jgi:hypothetical protein
MRCLDDSTVLRFASGQLDDTVRRAVEDEIGSCRHCSALVAELIRGSAALHVESEDRDAPECEQTGAEGPDRSEWLSRYVLGPMIARGGMGTILAAFDRRLGRSVAVKRMDRNDPSLAERFRREIRITASLQHPGIVPIYDAGVLGDGQPFYAMRHVLGASLEQTMVGCDGEGKRLGLLVSVLAAAEAVAYAHERGIVHRDLKPSNILVGLFGETVVIDWGLAGIEDTASERAGSDVAHDHDPMTTRRGSVLGTPRYMAPEQARGAPATRRSDVYALGALLYHALSGVPPVAGDQVTLVLERVARAEVRPLREIAPGLPGDLVAIVERAMAFEPETRYASAGELAGDLRRFQTGQLVAAHHYSRGELVWRFVKRHRAAVVFAALLISVLAVGGTLSVRGIVRERERAEDPRSLAERERAGVEDHLAELARSDAPELLLEWAYGLRGYAAFERQRGRLAAARPAIERALELVDDTPASTDLPVMTYYRASVLAEAATEQDRHGQRREALAAWQRAATLLRGLARRVPLESDWARALNEIDGELDRRASRTDRSQGRR